MASSTPAQRRILGIENRIQRLIGESPAALFRDARRLADDSFGLESQAALIWHCGREIESAIHAALNPMAPFDTEANKDRKRAAQVEAIIKELELDAADPAIVWWKKAQLHRLAHRPNLGPPRAFTPGDWQTFLSALDLILAAFEARYQRMIDRLDVLLAMTPTEAHAEIAQLLCFVPPTGQATALRHFFVGADARWLDVLPRCVLNDPPGRQFVTDPPGGYYFPAWHASEYLAKIAPDRPTEVFDRAMTILAKRPENPWIHIDFVNAAASFDAMQQAMWARLETVWLAAQPYLDFRLSKDFAKGVKMLLDGGLLDEGFALAQAILALGDGSSSQRHKPLLRTHEYEYRQALEVITPALTLVDPERTAALLIDLVDGAVEQAYADTRDRWSLLWRSSIADDGTDDAKDALTKLTDALRDALEAAAPSPDALLRLHTSLSSHAATSLVFARLATHLVTIGCETNPLLTRATLLDAATYTPDSWLEARRLIETLGPDTSAENIAAITAAIRSSSLSQQRQDEMVAALDGLRAGATPEPIVGQRLFKAFRYEPPPSPVSAERLGRWSVPRAVRYLTTWQANPAQHRDGDMLEYAFLAAVKANASRWSGAGAQVVGLPPDFLLRYLEGLREAAKDGAALNGKALVRLLEEGLVAGRTWLSPGYEDVRKSAAWILRDCLGSDRIRLSAARSRDALWTVIGALLSDPSGPTVTRSGRDDDGLPLEALNHTRAIAVTVVISYSVWLCRQTKRPRARRLTAEARLLLGDRLDFSERSATVRFAVGEQLSVLWWLDPTWTDAALPRIFPTQETEVALRDAAWSGYLWHGNVPLDFLRTLLPEYLRAAAALDPDGTATKADERLAAHIMLLARIGTIGPDSDDGLVALLFHRASAGLAKEAVEDLGRYLYDARDRALDPGEAARSRVLWEWLAAEVTEGRTHPAGLEPFGWWFASGQFDQDWSLDELERLANANVQIEFLYVALERLRDVVTRDPARAGRVTEAVVAHEFRDMELRDENLQGIVRVLLAEASGPVANKHAKAIVSMMLARGFPDFPGADGPTTG